MHEAHRDGNFRTSSLDEWKESDYGSNEVTSFEVVGMGDLTKQMKFISPDDGNPDDKTVFQVKLPRPVAPGAGRAVQDQVQGDVPRSHRAHRLQAHVPAGGAVVPQGRRVVARASGIAISFMP